ncbi:hypothetical protein LMG28688_01042 [Paraburkholderia caffeinitolerans]|uniref:Uncharacterized protein n=1 Tax=Paraburkholderia caffeinitolerans TaxID=1723730 RepID=A0A6J5FLA2_9BURK|nr:hypothetical protein LMG28688_01042 [Paraburkholderia caffeinitolerans]
MPPVVCVWITAGLAFSHKPFSDVGIISKVRPRRSVDQGGERWVIRGMGEGRESGVLECGFAHHPLQALIIDRNKTKYATNYLTYNSVY